jgi:transcriptional accessory protein Tex/SPT6
LAELVKIDPKAIGQYQHDDQTKLKEELDNTVIQVV